MVGRGNRSSYRRSSRRRNSPLAAANLPVAAAPTFDGIPSYLPAIQDGLKEDGPNLCGLKWYQNNCYMLAAVQLVASTKSVRRWASGEFKEDDSSEECRTIALAVRGLVLGNEDHANLGLAGLYHLHCGVDNENGSRKYSIFDVGQQEDSGMFMAWMADVLPTSIFEQRWNVDISFSCTNMGCESAMGDMLQKTVKTSFVDFHLPLGRQRSAATITADALSLESDDSGFALNECPKCKTRFTGSQQTTKKAVAGSFSDLVVVRVQRVQQSGNSGGAKKI